MRTSPGPLRCFVVGCPRSGTTFLQSHLAAHPAIVSFGESHAFSRLYHGVGLIERSLVPSWSCRKELVEYLRHEGLSLYSRRLTRAFPMRDLLARLFLEALDAATGDASASVWVEKTPGHLREIRHISRVSPSSRFIHIIRTGPETIASLYQTTRDNPEVWGGARSLDECIDRWVSSVEISTSLAGRRNHALVLYEDLLEEPRRILAALCAFMDIAYDEAMIENRLGNANRLIREEELGWKGGVLQPAPADSSKKLGERLTADQLCHVEERISRLLQRVRPRTRIPGQEA